MKGFVPISLADGTVIWCRRTGDALPAAQAVRLSAGGLGSLSDACVVWLKSDRVTMQDSTTVGQWNDKSGQRHNFTRNDGRSGLLYVPGEVGSRPLLRGLIDRSGGLSCDWSLATTETSIFLVCSTTSAGSTYLCAGAKGGCGIIENWPWAGSSIEWINGSLPKPDRYTFCENPAPGLHVMSVVQRDNVVIEGYFDGIKVFAAVPKFASNAVATVGNCHDGKQLGTTGDVREFLQFNRALSPQEIDDVHKYLTA